MKAKWAVCKNEDLEAFPAEIRGHTISIEILLLTVHMNASTMDARKNDSQHKSLVSRIQDLSHQTMSKLSTIADNVAQTVQQGM